MGVQKYNALIGTLKLANPDSGESEILEAYYDELAEALDAPDLKVEARIANSTGQVWTEELPVSSREAAESELHELLKNYNAEEDRRHSISPKYVPNHRRLIAVL